jgi:hypothetical protein
MLARSFGTHAMLKNAIAALVLGAALPAMAAERISVAGEGAISLGEWGKVLNNIVFACKSPGDPGIYGSLMIQMNVLLLTNGQAAKASPDGACRPLVGGTEVQLVRTAENFHDVICVRPHEEQNCLWVFKLGIVSTYDRGEIGTQEMISLSNKLFDHIHPECEGWPESVNLPAHCY